MSVIDADTHVIESEATWEYFQAPRGISKPSLVPATDPRTGVASNYWMIDGRLVPKPDGKGGQRLATPPLDGVARSTDNVTWAWRSLEDPTGRVSDANKRGVDLQVIIPTLFLADIADDAESQVALSRAYNRFMGERWEASGRRFGWTVVPPLRSIDESTAELKYGAEHGACGVLFHGIEIDRSLGDSYFFPIYKAASEHNLPICVHTGPGSQTISNLMDSRLTRNFGQNRVLPLMGFHDLVFNRIPERFPELRIGFLESCASWVPFLTHFFRRSVGQSGRDPEFFGPQLFEEYRLYIAVEADEDIPYIAQYTGWDHLLIGSDYGHTDQSAELDYVSTLERRDDLGEVHRALLTASNPGAFYGRTA